MMVLIEAFFLREWNRVDTISRFLVLNLRMRFESYTPTHQSIGPSSVFFFLWMCVWKAALASCLSVSVWSGPRSWYLRIWLASVGWGRRSVACSGSLHHPLHKPTTFMSWGDSQVKVSSKYSNALYHCYLLLSSVHTLPHSSNTYSQHKNAIVSSLIRPRCLVEL